LKLLKDLLYKAGLIEVVGSTNIMIRAICFDSRKAEMGGLFIATKGANSDGHTYINQTILAGVTAVVCEELPGTLEKDVTYLKVKDSALALGYIAANFYDNPSSELKLVGITGTNGKTTTATLLFRLFRKLGYNVGLLSTVQNQINETVIPATHTTPDSIQLNALLRQMRDNDCTHCFMEVSSHAIVQNRIAGISFAGAVFTNITHDHLDFHKTFDNYIKAKKRLFDDFLTDTSFALVNTDDKNGAVMVQNTKAHKKSYSLRSMSDFKCKIIENQFNGLVLEIDGHELFTKLIGTFNAYNILAVYATASLLKEDKVNVLTILSNLNSVEGRFEYIVSKTNVTGIIDYAHTPDALKNVLSTINDIRTGNEKVYTIIGCGGDRDAMKRPVMAGIACELSDKVIFTSDNPRSEDPEDILNEMQKGVPPHYFKKAITIADRKEAIKAACAMAQAGDIILVAGKGHEKYQEIKGIKHPFDDRQVLEETFTGISQ
jgi:UDP-N-acetylmuramoyl-L-alanyl-D-glutamate--2,6-diaminopimelate ligase